MTYAVKGHRFLPDTFPSGGYLAQAELFDVANSAEFAHLSPAQIVPRLADQGRYIASESSFYRYLKQAKQLRHRALSRPPQVRVKPRALYATAPNQVYSWDITYLPTTIKGKYFYLYLVMDIFSRKIVGWQVYAEESGEHAAALMTDVCLRESIARNQVVLHSDNGAAMKSAGLLACLQKLGVATSYSRPAVSNDNPYSESLFKTLKYRPEHSLSAFENLLAARRSVTQLVHWYNEEHRHSAIQFVTPAQRHAGQDTELLDQRKTLYLRAKDLHPERWSGVIKNFNPVDEVYLNPERKMQFESLEKEVQIFA